MMRAGGSAALDGDQADLHALAFDHRPFGGGIALADGYSRELGEVEKKAPVARLGCTPVPGLLCPHSVPPQNRSRQCAVGTLYARAGISRLQPMYTGACSVCFSFIRRRTCHVEEDVGLGAVFRDRHSAFGGGRRFSRE